MGLLPGRICAGPLCPHTHFYADIAEMNTQEAECAGALEMNARVKY